MVLGVLLSRTTLINTILALPYPAPMTAAVLGVDDFALRRGHRYATIVIDAVTGRAVDVLPDRQAQTLTDWLHAHPGVAVICRDRSATYAQGARESAPEAMQVVDRFHLWRNLIEAVDRVVIAHRACLRAPTPDDLDDDVQGLDDGPDGETAMQPEAVGLAGDGHKVADRYQARHQMVQALLAQRVPLREIARRLHLGRHTVQ